MRLDPVDRQIVAELLVDGRQSYAVLGRAVGLSASAAKRRVDRLVRERVISGFTAVVAAGVAGGTEAFVELHCQHPTARPSTA